MPVFAPGKTPVAVFLHAGEYDRVHQGLSIAAAAVAAGRPAHVFFFWWALERLAKGAVDGPEFSPPRDDVSDRFETRQLPTIRSLLTFLRESGLAHTYGCTGSLAAMAVESSGMAVSVDQFVGWSTILQLTAGLTDRFYL
ncbi:MAG: hypothetical protein ACT4TC_00480 [Myxococcaceae bacterium]